MNILETVADQSDAMQLPLYAVTVTAVAREEAPALLSLHWHGFLRQTPLQLPGLALPARPVPQSMAQFDLPPGAPGRFDELERALLEAAWQLGAWDVERLERPAWWRLGAPATEVSDGRRAFGYFDEDDTSDDSPHLIAEAPDRQALMRLAAHRGYLRWLFRPRKRGLWAAVPDGDDATLDDSGGRALPCPVMPEPPHADASAHRTVYRLGRADRIVLGGL
jgi:hypothetical protein